LQLIRQTAAADGIYLSTVAKLDAQVLSLTSNLSTAATCASAAAASISELTSSLRSSEGVCAGQAETIADLMMKLESALNERQRSDERFASLQVVHDKTTLTLQQCNERCISSDASAAGTQSTLIALQKTHAALLAAIGDAKTQRSKSVSEIAGPVPRHGDVALPSAKSSAIPTISRAPTQITAKNNNTVIISTRGGGDVSALHAPTFPSDSSVKQLSADSRAVSNLTTVSKGSNSSVQSRVSHVVQVPARDAITARAGASATGVAVPRVWTAGRTLHTDPTSCSSYTKSSAATGVDSEVIELSPLDESADRSDFPVRGTTKKSRSRYYA
jgi:hypothetical protein